ncbi:MAG TPA: serine/threonine-protein kinase [Caulobacteraceae bacterium]|nr:serine/threonine-protein kinase [Caulobacteraceae bacterium]
MNAPYHSKALPEGTILREWKLEQVLGVGGFGIVYRARGVYFDELVAIKEYFPGAISDRTDGETVTPTDSSSEEVYSLGLEKFLEEAKVLWNLSKPERHPNIVSVRSLFEIHGTAYMVMDFETGASLSEQLRDGKTFDEKSLLGLIKPIAEGLDRAHKAGVLHRDIKPANILVDDTGRSVLIDFGSARFDSGQATSTKVTFYTPPYAAIEQYVKTYPQGPWTDIYALGVVMYQCITGEKPPEVLERMHAGLGESLSAKPRAGYSRAFTRAVDAAMAIQPSARPQTVADWLKLFDATDADLEDDATRVVVAPTPAPPAAEAAPAAAAAAAAPAAKAPPAAAAPKKKAAPPKPPKAEPAAAAAPADAAHDAKHGNPLVWILVAAGVGVVALGAAAVLFLHPALPRFGAPKSGAAPVVASKAAPAKGGPAAGPVVAAAPGAPVPDVGPLAQAADQFAADVKRMGRGRAETGAVAAADAKIDGLAAQVKALPPNGGAQAAPLVDQMNTLAVGMAHSEAAALARSASGQMGSLAPSTGSSDQGASAVAAARKAKSNLDGAAASAAQTSDPTSAMAAARQTMAAYNAFTAAYGAASRASTAAKQVDIVARGQKTLEALDASARSTSAAVTALANSNRPGIFASRAKKDAFKIMQANSGRGQADLAQLDQLVAATRSSTDAGTVSAAVARATSLKGDLTALYSSSYAAAHASDAPAASAAPPR